MTTTEVAPPRPGTDEDTADELALEPGVLAVAAVKATNVVVEVPPS